MLSFATFSTPYNRQPTTRSSQHFLLLHHNEDVAQSSLVETFSLFSSVSYVNYKDEGANSDSAMSRVVDLLCKSNN